MHLHIFDGFSSKNCTFLTDLWSYYAHFCPQFIKNEKDCLFKSLNLVNFTGKDFAP